MLPEGGSERGYELGPVLLALRESRGWDPIDLVREMRKASDQPLARELRTMTWAWETGRRLPSPRYMRVLRRVYPELAADDGEVPEIAALLAEARRVTQASDIPALTEAARATGKPELAALAARLAHLGHQIDENTARLQKLLDAAAANTARTRELLRGGDDE